MRLSNAVSFLFAVAVSGIGSLASAADWHGYMNGPTRAGYTSESPVLPLAPRWIYQSPASPQSAWAGPRAEPIEGLRMRARSSFDEVIHVTISGGRLYFGSSVDHQLHCADAATGQPLWNFFTGGPIRLSPTVDGDRVYVGSDDGRVYCVAADDGRLIWQLRVGPADERILARGRMISRWPVRTGVLVRDGVAYFGAGIFPHETVYLVAASAGDGTIIWRNDELSQTNAQRDDLSPQGHLLAAGDLLFVPSGGNLPAAFDIRTGRLVHRKTVGWRTDGEGEVGGSRALLADGQIFTFGSQHFLAMDQQTGRVGYAWFAGHEMAAGGENSYLATGSHIVAVDRAAHAAATAKRHALFLKRSALLRQKSDEKVAAELAELERQMAELASEGVLWRSPSPCDASLIIAGNTVFAGGQDRVEAFDAATGQPKMKLDVRGKAGGLAAANGLLYVSTDEGKIYAFGQAPAPGSPVAPATFPAAAEKSPFPADALTPLYESAAKQILEVTGVDGGFCLVLGSERGRLAWELARRSSLTVYGIESDGEKAKAARKALDRAGLYGSRVVIVEGNPAQPPFSNYFANLVVSDTLLVSGKLPCPPEAATRMIKPCGGIACLGAPSDAGDASKLDAPALRALLDGFGLGDDGSVRVVGTWGTLTRGKLPGAGDWSHQYGDSSNTSWARDERIKGGLRVLWYGDPGPAPMINRHEAAVAPLSANGRMFIQGLDSILAYDAYNGRFLWEYKNPGALRTGVFNNEETGNLVASDDALFVAIDEKCVELDAATGKVRATHVVPESSDGIPRAWGYVAYRDGLLFGTGTIRSELERALRRRGKTVKSATDSLFAVDVKSGRRIWTHRGQNILHVTIAVSEGRVYFIDSSISQQEREALLKQDKTDLARLVGDAARLAEEELKRLDVRTAVALDAASGRILWSRPVDVTDCSYVGIGGGNLTLMYHDGHVLICGANANGHYWKQFLAGDFSRRRLVVLDATDGSLLWAKDANYRHRPVIVDRQIIAEPWSFELQTGKQRMRQNPLTGEEAPWQFCRPGHHCGTVTAASNMLFFRSGFTGYYDLYADSGTSHFAGHRLGCWVNAIPGNGLVMIPEASAGCVCLFSVTSTVVLEPRDDAKPWGIFSAGGSSLPVKHLALNLGAPGDRREAIGTLWLGYPRPASKAGLDLPLEIQPKFLPGGGYYSHNTESHAVANADEPWLFASGARGLARCEIPLLGEGDSPAKYTVRLYFSEPNAVKPGERLFDVKLQGNTVLNGFDVAKEAGGPRRAITREFRDVPVSKTLVLDLVPGNADPTPTQLPIIAAIEVARQE